MSVRDSLIAGRDPSVWFVVCDTDLRDLLARAGAGEDIDMLLIEFYANTEADSV